MKSAFLLFVSLSVILLACDRKPFVEHKVDMDVKANTCGGQQAGIRMISNFGGERYEFEKCLPADYDKKLVVSERKGDTVFVKFPSIADAYPKSLYSITLDIDSYPKYNFIQIDGETITIIPSAKQ